MPSRITALEKMRGFVESYPDADILDSLSIDYTDSIPNNGGLFPSGMIEISRRKDILPPAFGGRTTVVNQYNFALYTVFKKAENEDAGATINAEWLMDFQQWVQEQSISHTAPVFGDEPRTETITAQNGSIYSAEDEGTAMYVIQISVTFTKYI